MAKQQEIVFEVDLKVESCRGAWFTELFGFPAKEVCLGSSNENVEIQYPTIIVLSG